MHACNIQLYAPNSHMMFLYIEAVHKLCQRPHGLTNDDNGWRRGERGSSKCWHWLNLFIYQARQSLAWSQQGFWQPSFCRKRNLWRLCFDGKTKVKFLCIASIEKRKSGDKSIFHPLSILMLPLSSRKAVNISTTRFPQSKQRLHKIQFLQKLGCQKPCWDQARLCLAW